MYAKIGITGGSGYIGYSLAKYLQRNFEVKMLDVKYPCAKRLEGNINFVHCDVDFMRMLKKV